MWTFKKPWKLVLDNPELISYELASKDLSVRIEARQTEENIWTIFKTYHDDASFTYTQEYRTQSRDEAQKVIASLQNEKLFSKKELHELKLVQAKKVAVKVKRQFKDYNVEKWNFAVNDDAYENVVYIRDADVSDVSIIMHEKNKPFEANIMYELKNVLGFDTSDLDIKQELYYYSTKSDDYKKNNKFSFVFGNVEMGFDVPNDEK